MRERIVVAADGSGDYATIREAVDAVPEGRAKATTICISRSRRFDWLARALMRRSLHTTIMR
ncbi:pectinesterase family protein [Paenibacillus sp. NEAU-GSW1]|uniref:pectinesterase family protein n=1 Tax=Paenibacillus sp. NEAU-GSW1 TaxID=2682486 RepID=UPI0020A624A4|nr:pectinesterase family protein [Paenibacillus sp. NEAU-GSW1]